MSLEELTKRVTAVCTDEELERLTLTESPKERLAYLAELRDKYFGKS